MKKLDLDLDYCGYGLVISNNLPDFLVGRLLTLVETMGLKDTQEKAVKDLFRGEVWNLFGPERSISITPNLHKEIIRATKEYQDSFKGKLVSEDADKKAKFKIIRES